MISYLTAQSTPLLGGAQRQAAGVYIYAYVRTWYKPLTIYHTTWDDGFKPVFLRTGKMQALSGASEGHEVCCVCL